MSLQSQLKSSEKERVHLIAFDPNISPLLGPCWGFKIFFSLFFCPSPIFSLAASEPGRELPKIETVPTQALSTTNISKIKLSWKHVTLFGYITIQRTFISQWVKFHLPKFLLSKPKVETRFCDPKLTTDKSDSGPCSSKAQKQFSARKSQVSFNQMFHKYSSIIAIIKFSSGKLKTQTQNSNFESCLGRASPVWVLFGSLCSTLKLCLTYAPRPTRGQSPTDLTNFQKSPSLEQFSLISGVHQQEPYDVKLKRAISPIQPHEEGHIGLSTVKMLRDHRRSARSPMACKGGERARGGEFGHTLVVDMTWKTVTHNRVCNWSLET